MYVSYRKTSFVGRVAAVLLFPLVLLSVYFPWPLLSTSLVLTVHPPRPVAPAGLKGRAGRAFRPRLTPGRRPPEALHIPHYAHKVQIYCTLCNLLAIDKEKGRLYNELRKRTSCLIFAGKAKHPGRGRGEDPLKTLRKGEIQG